MSRITANVYLYKIGADCDQHICSVFAYISTGVKMTLSLVQVKSTCSLNSLRPPANCPLALRKTRTCRALGPLLRLLLRLPMWTGVKRRTTSLLRCLRSTPPSCCARFGATATCPLRAPGLTAELVWRRWDAMSSPTAAATPLRPTAAPTPRTQRAQPRSRAQGLQPRPVPPTATTSITTPQACATAIPQPAPARPRTQSGRELVPYPPPWSKRVLAPCSPPWRRCRC